MNLSLKQKLDKEANYRNSERELGFQASPDPIQIAHRHKDEYSALICALLAYGNAKAIVRYLEKLDFSLLDAEDENDILNAFFSPYRFQKPEDIRALFLALNRLKRRHSLNELFLEKFSHKNSVFSGVSYLQKAIYEATPHKSRGYSFLVGNMLSNPNSPMKRWMMYLRWMIRKDAIDMGLWHGVGREHLLIPLDTHTHRVAQALGLLKRKSYDLKSVIALTDALRLFDPLDPVKYDFALFRLGQEKLLN